MITFPVTFWSSVSVPTKYVPLNGLVNSITEYNGSIYVGGSFTEVDGNGIVGITKYENGEWVSLGGGINGSVTELRVFNGTLFAGGTFTEAGGLECNHVAIWDGNEWSIPGLFEDVPAGVAGSTINTSWEVSGVMYIAGQGHGGNSFIGQWDGTNWSVHQVDVGMYYGTVYAAIDVDEEGYSILGGYNSGSISRFYALDNIVSDGPLNSPTVGGFTKTDTHVYTVTSSKIERRPLSGGSWEVVASLPSSKTYPYPTGMTVYDGRVITGIHSSPYIQQWDGVSALESFNSHVMNGYVYELYVFEDHIYAGGAFTTFDGEDMPYFVFIE